MNDWHKEGYYIDGIENAGMCKYWYVSISTDYICCDTCYRHKLHVMRKPMVYKRIVEDVLEPIPE